MIGDLKDIRYLPLDAEPIEEEKFLTEFDQDFSTDNNEHFISYYTQTWEEHDPSPFRSGDKQKHFHVILFSQESTHNIYGGGTQTQIEEVLCSSLKPIESQKFENFLYCSLP